MGKKYDVSIAGPMEEWTAEDNNRSSNTTGITDSPFGAYPRTSSPGQIDEVYMDKAPVVNNEEITGLPGTIQK